MEQEKPLQKVFVRGVRYPGKHGCDDYEKKNDQTFVTDVVVEGNFSTAGTSDQMRHTVDYLKIEEVIKKTITSRIPKNTLEYLARQIASRIVFQHQNIQRVTVTISKPDKFDGVGYPGIEATYLRSDFEEQSPQHKRG